MLHAPSAGGVYCSGHGVWRHGSSIEGSRQAAGVGVLSSSGASPGHIVL